MGLNAPIVAERQVINANYIFTAYSITDGTATPSVLVSLTLEGGNLRKLAVTVERAFNKALLRLRQVDYDLLSQQ